MPEARSWPHRGSRLSALIMRANGPGRFCQVFLRVIHYFSPSVPFRPDNRTPPHTSRKSGLSGPTTAATGRRPLGPLGPVDPARSSASFVFV